MINDLIQLATHLDNKGLHKEANYVDSIIKEAKFKDMFLSIFGSPRAKMEARQERLERRQNRGRARDLQRQKQIIADYIAGSLRSGLREDKLSLYDLQAIQGAVDSALENSVDLGGLEEATTRDMMSGAPGAPGMPEMTGASPRPGQLEMTGPAE